MPSFSHQWLVVWAARRMLRDGFIVSGFDGDAPRGDEWSFLPVPFMLDGVRVDTWGIREHDRMIALGEAKTFDDIDTAHTRRQLRVFGKTRLRGSATFCPFYIAIPRSAVYELDRVLIDVGLLRARHVLRVHVPDVLLKDISNDPREAYRTRL